MVMFFNIQVVEITILMVYEISKLLIAVVILCFLFDI